MNSKINLLIFPAESENAFEVFDALRFATRFEIWGASNLAGYGKYIFENYQDNIPNIQDKNFLKIFNKFLIKKNIKLIIPTHDDVALFLAKNKKYIAAKIMVSSAECAKFCREKKLLYKKFKNEYFCPTIFESPEKVEKWPVFVKPSKGQGSKGCKIIPDKKELIRTLKREDEIIISEYLPGEEITIDCFTNNLGKLLFIGPRSREKIKIGISFVSQSIELSQEISNIAHKINKKIIPKGLWFFQLKKDVLGNFKLLETSCRISSSVGIYRQAGINLPLIAAYEAIGMPITIPSPQNHVLMRRRLHSKYTLSIKYNSVYVDYDDTLIINHQVNTDLLSYLYKCKNKNIKLFLITKHDGNLIKSLEKHCISQNLFEEIYHLDPNDLKSQYIKNKSSIFIDNLYSERCEVAEKLHIPVFDVDAIDSLINI